MERLSDLIRRVAQPGTVIWIGVRSARRAEMSVVESARIDANGLVGDHARPGKRAISLIQAEHLAAIGSYLGRPPVQAHLLRRNLLIEGINLASLKGRELQVGTARVRITGLCAPCSRMEQAFGPGGYAAVRGHGGWCAEVRAPGDVRVGDRVFPAD